MKRVEIQFDDDDEVYLDLKSRADKLGLTPRKLIEQLLRADYWSRRGVDVGLRLVGQSHQEPASGEDLEQPQPDASGPGPEAKPPARPGAANLARSFVVRPPGQSEGGESSS